MRVLVTVTTPVHPTEDVDRVIAAATRYFPGEVHVAPDMVTVVHDELATLRRRVWELRIIDTFRGALLHGLSSDGRATSFRISKQAAHAGRVALPPAPQALGELEVTVEVTESDPWPDAEALAWWLCPETREGEVVGPVD